MYDDESRRMGEGSGGRVITWFSNRLQINIARKFFSSETAFNYEIKYNKKCIEHRAHNYSQFICRMLAYHRPFQNWFIMDMELASKDLSKVAFHERVPSNCPELPTAQSVDKAILECLRGVSFLNDTAKILHNDIKPLNILLKPDGQFCIADLGIARDLANGPGHGTIGFTAPEVYGTEFADPRGHSGKSDIFSLGIAFYTVVEGLTIYPIPAGAGEVFDQLNRCNDRDQRHVYAQRLYELMVMFFRRNYKVTVPRGRNVSELSQAAQHILADMTAAMASLRPTASRCLDMFMRYQEMYEELRTIRATDNTGIEIFTISDDSPATEIATFSNDNLASSSVTPGAIDAQESQHAMEAALAARAQDNLQSEAARHGATPDENHHPGKSLGAHPENSELAQPNETLGHEAGQNRTVSRDSVNVSDDQAEHQAPTNPVVRVTFPVFQVNTVERQILERLANVAVHCADEVEFTEALQDKDELLAILQTLRAVDSKMPKPRLAKILLDVVFTANSEIYGERKRIFLLITQYSVNWWHKNEERKALEKIVHWN